MRPTKHRPLSTCSPSLRGPQGCAGPWVTGQLPDQPGVSAPHGTETTAVPRDMPPSPGWTPPWGQGPTITIKCADEL